MADDSGVLEAFLTLSATLTGYSRFRLLGTGQAEPYLATTLDAVGDDALGELLSASTAVHDEAAGDERALDQGLRARILSDDKLGPVARNVIKMWFVGTWYQLPQEWRDAHASRQPDSTHVVSPASYTEGLLWPTIGANPPGAKGQGYGTWSSPPTLDLP
ncbi:hypothetical protein NSZ01_27480 [Nocardioides szechwanensis]|uniref:Membrane bound FAD containing D-sorbitol dehydrogenase n=1 Tax=Nocardioides szechwanensis TaxID=1005944 RepID=A0A1H0J1U9_9ACTN|nr:hypothetical protein [Nocardioides szechwanensis]GEP34980.1 hypothetical protein NSZ01_27480 [Nocardioides szechwanensis]SDO37582.1 hypothetical protein SAMN05192576_3882 [Nocardioides szechwanensis]